MMSQTEKRGITLILVPLAGAVLGCLALLFAYRDAADSPKR